jgi:hypothetical protein
MRDARQRIWASLQAVIIQCFISVQTAHSSRLEIFTSQVYEPKDT